LKRKSSMLPHECLANVLYIDLANKRSRVESRPELFEKHIGGAGVAIRLLAEECPQGCDPLSPENPIIFAVGPLTGLFPLASKTVAMFKSPLTGNLGESHCGGRSAVAIRLAGYGAIVIKGAGQMPLYLSIQGDKVFFRDASSIWGMQNSMTVGRIIRDNETGSGQRTIMRIGGAGEKLVSYACVTTETYRHFGRLGLGAVFGSKKLKAIVVSGKRSLPVSDRPAYREIYDEIYERAVGSSVMKKYHDLGTAENVIPLNALGGLPTRNLQQARFEQASAISGETFAEQYLGRRLACSHCPVGCIHIAALREPYTDEEYFYKTHMISYDYEPIYSLGSMLGLGHAADFLRLMEQVEIFALDAMSAGVVLAWATEAQQKNLISEKETGGLKFAWGDWQTYIQAIKKIVSQPNDFYRALARGVEYASSSYGGKDFALAFGGNEMPGYHTGAATYAGVLLGARHSHLDNAGYSVDQKLMNKPSPSPAELARSLLTEEQWRQVLSSLVVCFFARGIYEPERVCRALRVPGLNFGLEDLQRVGREILTAKYNFKRREGFSLEGQRLPGRIFETPSATGKIEEDYLRQTIEQGKQLLRAYNPSLDDITV
jgi:aldehyde:ferredoxin oxidoreductase